MTDPNEENFKASDAILSKRIDLPLVWFLPVIALLVSAWLIYKSASEKGLVITIDFPTAEGLEVDKTKIRYLDVDVGKVTAISINDDLKTIRVTALMNKAATGYLKAGAHFWVVKPQVGLSGISGLSTLLSGSYIELKPGLGERQQHYTGLISPPILKSEINGKQFILETNSIGSISPGTPIHFLGIPAGEVLSQDLAKTGDAIQLTVFINAPYDSFVRKNTRFWINSGIDLSAGADGFKVRTGPLVALLSGGIAFRASPKDSVADLKPENSVFQLYDTYDESTQITYTNSLKYVMHFNGSVRGLAEGAPVQLRGIPVGRVIDISLELDKKTAEIKVPVIVEIEPERIVSINDNFKVSHEDIMAQLIDKGLRAQLQTGSLVTGQLLIDLDFHPESKRQINRDRHGAYPEFPTTANSFDEITHSAQIIMDKLAKLPLDKMTDEINQTLKTLQDTSKTATALLTATQGTMTTANDALLSVKDTLAASSKTLKSAQNVLGNLEPGSTGYYEFHKLLQELTKTAGAMKQLADYLEQHPESLIRGKEEE